MPITVASTVAARPTSRLMREPQTSCVQMLRPSLSVPSGPNSLGLAHAVVGGRVDRAQPGLVGEQRRRERHQHEERRARRARPSRRGCAGSCARRRRARGAGAARRSGARSGAATVLTRVRTRGSSADVEQVGEQVEEDHRGAEDEEQPLEHRQVGALERLVGGEPEAGPGEDRLDRDRAREHEAEVDRDQRDDRQQRVRHRVAVAHRARRAAPWRARARGSPRASCRSATSASRARTRRGRRASA